jgi:dTDP-4-dehydrorhamnose reductase
VNAAAYTAVDRAETEEDLAMQVNAIAPGILAEQAKRRGALLVHYSTDYVFDGSKTAPYSEEDAPNPINAYGRSKLEGERRIVASGCRYLLLRTSWVYAPRGRNFFLAIAKKARAGEPLRVVSDQHGVPGEARFVAEATWELMQRSVEGVFNVVPSGDTTWHGFAKAIVEGLGLQNSVNPIASSEYPTPARRPVNSILDNKKLSEILGETPPHWREFLDRCMKAWKPA